MIRVRGTGPDLVMIHGWGMHAGAWAALADELSERHTLHLVDLPGHGADGRNAPWTLGGFADEVLNATPVADWLGWSLGGQVALAAAARAPGQVRRLALIGTNPRFVVAPDWPHAMPSRAFDAFRQACVDDGGRILERFIGLQAMGAADPAATLRDLRRMLDGAPEPGHAALVAGLDILETADLRDRLPSLRMPALWIGGTADRVSPAAASQAAAALMPNGRYRPVEDAGHAPFVRHAAAVHALLDVFLAEGRPQELE
ncbi:pimeloyl-ACP methyl ester esterase BioH [Marinihelvus fidelis]|uniref:Pimeloyl-[acyl-carrier protein] methyl ester esterase n=1 Tax=Marinihelvus fidelis TaxID=2613842 RepID=A0A5N0TC05_9GAMM|nr:pimeloyl-ACP methyl ester esterase BioH [Marinihelvus fidelis]KAA9131366.1 pimeloyl-ACP methyl ester esterase BioH [Marinihelvus fidelis]